MKKIFLLLITVTGIIMLAGCGEKTVLGEEFTEEVNTLEGLSIRIDEASVTSTGLSYEIDNQSEENLSYGQDYSVQKQKDGKWYVLEGNPIAITMELLWLSAGESASHEVNWEDGFGKLAKGHYRLIKNMGTEEAGYYVAGEFTI